MTLGLDIGGANLKAAHTDGMAHSWPFALWKHPGELLGALRQLVATMPPARRLAVTMTGELCDCFPTQREGVGFILDAVRRIDPAAQVWCKGRFNSLDGAQENWPHAAASNWHALATYAVRFAPAFPAVLVDVGSTTTDIIPLPPTEALTDTERFDAGQLLYTGVRRTPVCAVLGAEGAAELFATMADVYLLTGSLPDDANNCDTADGRPATAAFAHARLARMRCADATTMSRDNAVRWAAALAERQRELMVGRIARVSAGMSRGVVVAGEGEFVARQAVATALPNAAIISLADQLGRERSTAACAVAVAALAEELS